MVEKKCWCIRVVVALYAGEKKVLARKEQKLLSSLGGFKGKGGFFGRKKTMRKKNV